MWGGLVLRHRPLFSCHWRLASGGPACHSAGKLPTLFLFCGLRAATNWGYIPYMIARRKGVGSLGDEAGEDCQAAAPLVRDQPAESFAFVSHHSACEALRSFDVADVQALPRWPARRRMLPVFGQCVTTQRQFTRLRKDVDLSAYGIVSTPVDLLVPSTQLRSRGKHARFHVWSRLIPARSMIRLGTHLLVSSPELVIVQLLSSQARLDSLFDAFSEELCEQRDVLGSLGLDEEIVAESPSEWEKARRVIAASVIACEFAGTYRLAVGSKEGRYHAPRLMTVSDLRSFAEDDSGRFIAGRLRKVADIAFDNSASPRETALALMLTMPPELGGFGLPKPRLNVPVDVSEVRGSLADRDAVTPDMLWAEQRVALEYDSAEFHGQSTTRRLAEDALRSNILTAMGYAVLRVTPGSVVTLAQIERLARQVACCLGVTLQRPTEMQEVRRRKAFAELMVSRGAQ